MQQLLSELRLILKDKNPELEASLRPGLPPDDVARKLATLPFEITPDAVELYAWADGVENQLLDIIPISALMPLDYAIERFEYDLEGQDELEAVFPQKFRDSFPFLSDQSDGGYGFGSVDSPCSGRIIEYVIHEEWAIGFDGLGDLLKTAMEGYRRNAYHPSTGWDIEHFDTIANELNPCRLV